MFASSARYRGTKASLAPKPKKSCTRVGLTISVLTSVPVASHQWRKMRDVLTWAALSAAIVGAGLAASLLTIGPISTFCLASMLLTHRRHGSAMLYYSYWVSRSFLLAWLCWHLFRLCTVFAFVLDSFACGHFKKEICPLYTRFLSALFCYLLVWVHLLSG